MTRADLQRSLIELGWISMIHRVLGGRPAESYALNYLMHHPDQDVSFAAIQADYEAHEAAGGSIRSSKGPRSGSDGAIRQRIGRLRGGLADLGVKGAIRTVPVSRAYRLAKRDAMLIEEIILNACGIELEVAA